MACVRGPGRQRRLRFRTTAAASALRPAASGIGVRRRARGVRSGLSGGERLGATALVAELWDGAARTGRRGSPFDATRECGRPGRSRHHPGSPGHVPRTRGTAARHRTADAGTGTLAATAPTGTATDARATTNAGTTTSTDAATTRTATGTGSVATARARASGAAADATDSTTGHRTTVLAVATRSVGRGASQPGPGSVAATRGATVRPCRAARAATGIGATRTTPGIGATRPGVTGNGGAALVAPRLAASRTPTGATSAAAGTTWVPPAAASTVISDPDLRGTGLGDAGVSESGLGESGLGESGLGQPCLRDPGFRAADLGGTGRTGVRATTTRTAVSAAPTALSGVRGRPTAAAQVARNTAHGMTCGRCRLPPLNAGLPVGTGRTVRSGPMRYQKHGSHVRDQDVEAGMKPSI